MSRKFLALKQETASAMLVGWHEKAAAGIVDALEELGQGSHLYGAERHLRHSMSQAGVEIGGPKPDPRAPAQGMKEHELGPGVLAVRATRLIPMSSRSSAAPGYRRPPSRPWRRRTLSARWASCGARRCGRRARWPRRRRSSRLRTSAKRDRSRRWRCRPWRRASRWSRTTARSASRCGLTHWPSCANGSRRAARLRPRRWRVRRTTSARRRPAPCWCASGRATPRA